MKRSKPFRVSHFLIQHRFITLVLTFTFVLRVPFLFEPLYNSSESMILTVSKNFLSFESLSTFEKLIFYPFNFVFFFLGSSVWSVKIFLSIWVGFFIFLIWFFLQRILEPKKARLFVILLAFIYSFEFFKTNQINFLSTLFLPLFSILIIFFPKFSLPKSTKFSLLISVLIGAVVLNLLTSKPNPNYYFSFFRYISSLVNEESLAFEKYYESFGTKVRQSYSLSSFIRTKTSKSDSIFLFSEKESLYYLSERNSALKDLDPRSLMKKERDIVTKLEDEPAKLLLVDEGVSFTLMDSFLNRRYNLTAQTENVKIYLLKKP